MAVSREIIIPTPPARPDRGSFTAGSDFVRGSSADDVLHRPLKSREQKIFDQLVDRGFRPADVLDALFLGDLRRSIDPGEARALQKLMERSGRNDSPLAVLPTLSEAIATLEADGNPAFDTGPAPGLGKFSGADRYFGTGGDDYIADLRGDNLVSTEDGNDRMLLGRGNDRVYDRGGDNRITDLGGNNLITTRDGDDIITTGGGKDVINAFDGRNIIDAGDGKNIARGGNGFDSITVGVGDDFVEVRNATSGEWETVDLPFIGITDYRAHNIVVDAGGSDSLRATGSSRNVDSETLDLLFNGNDLVLSDFGGEVLGDDVIELGGGDNIVVDMGGDNKVRTLEGDDIIFTSFLSSGDDEIDAGAGSDSINPGGGDDIVRGGPGEDFINLENDGDRDVLVYLEDDRSGSPVTTDIVLGFEGGRDMIDVSTLDLGLANLKVFNAALFGLVIGDPELTDLLIAWDKNRDGVVGQGDFFTTILADVDESTLTPANFLFDADLLA